MNPPPKKKQNQHTYAAGRTVPSSPISAFLLLNPVHQIFYTFQIGRRKKKQQQQTST